MPKRKVIKFFFFFVFFFFTEWHESRDEVTKKEVACDFEKATGGSDSHHSAILARSIGHGAVGPLICLFSFLIEFLQQ